MSGPHQDEPLELTLAQVQYYRTMYLEHTNDPDRQRCRVCDQTNCEDYRYARSQLIAAGVSVLARQS